MEEGPEVDGGHAQSHDGKHHREQGRAVFLPHLREADPGRCQQDGREGQRAVPRLAVAQQVEGGEIVEGCSVHLDGNRDRLRHKISSFLVIVPYYFPTIKDDIAQMP